MKKTEETPWLNRAQKEGLARVFDGFSIAEGITLFTHWAGRINLTEWDVGGLLFTFTCTVFAGLALRKD